MEKLKQFINQSCQIPNNTLVSLRFLCNLLIYPPGEELVFTHRVDLLENITTFQTSNKNIQISLATFLLNISILCLKRQDEIGLMILTSVIPEICTMLRDTEAQFRAYVALGTLLKSCSDKEGVKERIVENGGFMKALRRAASEYGNDAELKRKRCAWLVQNELFN